MSDETKEIKPADTPSPAEPLPQSKEDLSRVTQHPPERQAGASLLLEIGTEEIPARFLFPASSALKENTRAVFDKYFIEFSDIETYVTPRRLALMIKGIPPIQKDKIKEVFGPPRKVSFDSQGNPTKAAVAFAGSQGIDVGRLIIKQKEKGEYVVAVIRQGGMSVRGLIDEALKEIILSLNFPKSMRWADGNLRFVRPIHWITALFNGETVTLDLEGIKSRNITMGHRFLSRGALVIKEISSYLSLLENNFVIADQEKRRKIIENGIITLAASVNGKALQDAELLDTVTCLVEYPMPVLCEFPADYLKLPKELLITVMKDHQKYFAVEEEEGRLRNYFIVISNTKAENAGMIKVGAERVIKARFEDARFYYEEDIKKPLRARIDELKRVTFHDKLGTLYKKTERLVKVAGFLSEKLFPERKKSIEKAAWICKTDLISGVVREFPELQGLMGAYYAYHDGEDRDVAAAIKEQYLPAHAGGRLPETDEGAVLSLSDKIDNVVSFFGIGLTPTGSEDPFALRRQAIGIISILIGKGYPITLSEVVRAAVKNVPSASPSLTGEVLGFFVQRIEAIFTSQNFDADIIQSVMSQIDSLQLSQVKDRLQAIKRFTGESEYNDFLIVAKRIKNILPETKIPTLKKTLLSEDKEKALHSQILKVKPVVAGQMKDGNYYEALKTLARLSGPVNDFFNNVLVMDKRDEIKFNRFALLKEVWTTTSAVADFSKLKER